MPPALAVVIVACAPGSQPSAGEAGVDFRLGGVQIDEPDLDAWHTELLSSGFDTLAVTVYARQQAWDSAGIGFAEAELDGSLVEEIRAAEGRGLEVVLVLRVALEHALEENRFLWHGLIQPRTDDQVAEWFLRYGRFVVQWARVAEREGVEVLGIANELSSLTSTRAVDALPELEAYYLDDEKQAQERARIEAGARNATREVPRHELVGAWGETFDDFDRYLDARTAAQAEWARRVTNGGDVDWVNRRRSLLERHWRGLIAEVRSVYSGRLTLAANFDQYRQVGFWDALDLIGVNAYFPLRTELAPGKPIEAIYPQLLASWEGILGEIDAMRAERALEQRLLFTELGYTARRGSTIEPWAGGGFGVVGGRVDPGKEPVGAELVVWNEQALEPMERALAVRALAEAAHEVAPGMLGGLLWWKLSTVPAHREIERFLVVLGEEPEDPVVVELLALAAQSRLP